MPRDLWVPGNPDLSLLIELALAVACVYFIWRIAIIKEKTPRAMLALALFALGLALNVWAAIVNIAGR